MQLMQMKVNLNFLSNIMGLRIVSEKIWLGEKKLLRIVNWVFG